MFLEDRQKALEEKFFHDEEQNFKDSAKLIKELGLWASQKLSLNEEHEITYVKDIISLAIDDPSGALAIAKIEQDLDNAKISITSDEKQEILETFLK